MTGNNPKILILTHCFPTDSADIPGNFLLDFTKCLSDYGANVTVMTQKMNAVRDEEFISQTRSKIEYFDWKGGDKRFAQMKISSFKDAISIISLVLKGRKKYKQLVKADGFDFILSCWVIPAGIWALSLRKNNNSAVWALGSDISVYGNKKFFKPVIHFILSRSAIIFSNSFNLQNEILNLFRKKSKMLYTSRNLPVPTERYEKSETLKLVYIGRLEKIKGPDILISALILSKIEKFSLKIIGDGSLRKELGSTVSSNKLENKIEFLGMKSGAEIVDYLVLSDYLIISSISESMPVVFWESMQTSTPVLSTRVGDMEYYCEKYNVGRICDPDEKSLSELLSFAYNFRPLRDILSKNTAKVKELSSIESSANIIFSAALKSQLKTLEN
ncbi:MAG: glycosyltransferase [Candidatus Delongbacteria bacterium]|nr:glycosyltransferase [Candidatus Delongbacteria bacterium]MCG2760919.1 glycosyltransferase [Candidatus Delongbacteria bacterium]